jgi:UDP-GlcNAc:undecaprenyl-phosphate GlcNAc-1-phosphate transferase
MGDAGAMFLGCALASVSVEGALKSATAIALVPVIALGIPIFDTAFAIVRRVCNGRSVASADRSHIHHRLLEMGLSHKQAVVLLYMASGLLGLTAILSSELDFRTSMPITTLVLLGMYAGLKAFGILDLREQRRVK